MRRVARAMRWFVASGAVALALVCAWLAWPRSVGPRADAVAELRARYGFDVEERWVDANGVKLHVVLAGPESGTPVLLLHGLPDFWWGWHRQIGPLAARGFRVIVPDLRGHNRSDKPEAVEAYRSPVLKDDVVGLIDALGYTSVMLAGHDSGASLGRYLAIEHPERVRRLVSFGIPHPLAIRAMARQRETPLLTRVVYGTLRWLLHSTLPEKLVRANEWWLLVATVRTSGSAAVFPESDLPVYRQAWEQDDSFHYMMHWYRASFSEPRIEWTRSPHTEVPALVVVLGKDLFVPQEPVRRSLEHGKNIRTVELADTSHWVLHEEPERATELLLEFFTEP